MTAVEILAAGDPFDARRVRRALGLLGDFNEAGVLAAADVHVALRLGRFAGAGNGQGDEAVLLAAALAVRAPRLGHVCTDLATIRATAAVDVEVPVDLQALPWPDPQVWVEQVAASPLVAVGDDGHDDRPLRLAGTRLYLDRYWRDERQVAAGLGARAAKAAPGVDAARLAEGLDRLFPPGGPDTEPDLQRAAAACAVLRQLAVVAGGPGTGKTTTVARILALLDEQAAAAGGPPPIVALAAPTGKAAARLEEAVHAEGASIDVGEATKARLLALEASTLHRLLGWRPGSRSRFRHHRGNRLPHDVIVVDETSMVSLSLMAKLVDAVRAGARLVLVGDPEQLASVEAGAVLGDIVGPAAGGSEAGLSESVVVLRRVHRFGGRIAELAEAVRRGDADAALEVLRADEPGVRGAPVEADVSWIPLDPAEAGAGTDAALRLVREAVVDAGRRVVEAARGGDAAGALEALGSFRLLCAHRRGLHGVEQWMARVENWLAAEIDGFATGGAWYPGRPLLVTENDYGLRLYNGDTGVIVRFGDTPIPGALAGGDGGDGRVAAIFERRGELLEFSPTRLAAIETVHAMTIHKSQGSQFDTVAVVLPAPASPILTRELLYTAVTRARRRLLLVGAEDSVRAAVSRPIARSSGLRQRLWGDSSAGAG
jgi:exodeoxyribonuclease V alpha subunit